MLSRKYRRWAVTVWDNETDELIVPTRLRFARTAEEAGNAMGLWLELEGFEIEARMQIGSVDGITD
jgi:hypothetical protein